MTGLELDLIKGDRIFFTYLSLRKNMMYECRLDIVSLLLSSVK